MLTFKQTGNYKTFYYTEGDEIVTFSPIESPTNHGQPMMAITSNTGIYFISRNYYHFDRKGGRWSVAKDSEDEFLLDSMEAGETKYFNPATAKAIIEEFLTKYNYHYEEVPDFDCVEEAQNYLIGKHEVSYLDLPDLECINPKLQRVIEIYKKVYHEKMYNML